MHFLIADASSLSPVVKKEQKLVKRGFGWTLAVPS